MSEWCMGSALAWQKWLKSRDEEDLRYRNQSSGFDKVDLVGWGGFRYGISVGYWACLSFSW